MFYFFSIISKVWVKKMIFHYLYIFIIEKNALKSCHHTFYGGIFLRVVITFYRVCLPKFANASCRRRCLGMGGWRGCGFTSLMKQKIKGKNCFVIVCVFITAGPITKLFAGGGGGEWTTCAMIDDEPRPVWMSPLVTH